MKLKILFVIDSLNSGGAEKSLISLLSLFDYDKYDVDLLMFSRKGLYLSLLPKEVNVLKAPETLGKHQRINLKHLYLKLGNSLSLRNPFYKKFLHSSQINWKWKSQGIKQLDEKYDIAIAYSQGFPTYFVAEKVESTKKYCWINTDYKKASYNKKFDTQFYYQYNNIVAVSESNKEIFIKEMPLAKDKTLVIYDIISPKLVRTMSKQPVAYRDNYKGLKILTIGRLVDVKGYDLAIKACYQLKKEGLNFKWYSIGEGELKPKLEKLVKDYGLEDTFIFLGPHQNPYNYLKMCDIYVQPSRFEGFGMAIAEAKILHKPIISTNFPVVYNQIEDGKNGIIVSMNPKEISQGIKKIITNKELNEKIIYNLKHESMGTENEIYKLYSLIES
ncbi:glycosyltransferase [Rossellomorea aquimaris]|uniref:Glycosyltransferase involved in cell wall biosynthesis n=1 Tax=Rossellomorea aquimaris TaxID=189382 RepID=A0A366ELF6_9BACI|nr:glycosyltransferase [Rossellomorea aquimaris]RBP03154.1 glycosyltransferase involved in cell wall biosynthesis [Rossellomorea aquimaris]